MCCDVPGRVLQGHTAIILVELSSHEYIHTIHHGNEARLTSFKAEVAF